MTTQQLTEISIFRSAGLSYNAIALRTGISKNTIVSFLRRQGVEFAYCKNCGEKIKQTKGKKRRLFCSDKCRSDWWNNHSNLVKRKAYYSLTCRHCGNEFVSYGNKNRIYCSRDCYIADRFGKKGEHNE